MKRGNLYKIVYALFALLLVAACDKEEFAGIPADDGQPQKIRFDIAVATATAVPSGASTRVSTSTDGNYTSTFTADDCVGLYIVEGDSGLLASGNWVDNVPMTFDGEKWNYTLPEGKDCYPQGGKLSFYAYYPYNAQLTSSRDITFTVQADQSTTGFASSYLMTASALGVYGSYNPVKLVFSHKLALVRVNLKDGDEPKDKAPGPADIVTLKGRALNISLDLASDARHTSGGATDVKMYYNKTDKCWYALIPAQNVAAGSGLLTFEWTAITTLNHTTGSGFMLQDGQVKPLDITIDVNMTIDSNHVYAVGDAYPYVGFDKKGVVFEVSNGGKSGKIISLKREYGLEWSTDTAYVTNANNRQDGRVNMETIRERDNTFTKYPTFNWVHELTPANTTYADDSKGLWYLPADEELKPMYAADNKEKVSRKLKALGLEDPFPENNTYIWSSTEDSSNQQRGAHAMRLSDGTVSAFNKDEGFLYTWPIMAF